MQIYFIRHAQSTNNILLHLEQSKVKRVEDPEISELGKWQVEVLIDFLVNKNTGEKDSVSEYTEFDYHDFKIEKVYCSLMERAVQTGLGVSQALGVPLIAWEDLHENGGIVLKDNEEDGYYGMPGKNRSFFEENYPVLKLPSSLGQEGWWGSRPLESRDEMSERAKRVIQELFIMFSENENQKIAIITHGAFYNVLIKELLKATVLYQPWLSLCNTGVTRIDVRINPKWNDGNPTTSVLYANRVDHLPTELITV
ncbi:MAG: histidine phosphatase family protein [Anaerolineaceae bacterium]|nr:histidine phosphatase family protein [Anaerolineaceae bacterium]